jgi:acyl dehydratase
MTTIYASPRDLIGKEGTRFGPTGWITVDQDRVNGFAEVTGDHQWIHVDVARAKAGPFGGTIAHGFLTMSMVNLFLPELMEVRGFSHAVNVGSDRLRFLNPVKVGSRIRATSEIMTVEEIKGGIQAVVRVVVEVEGAEKPALTIDTISRYYPED